MGFGVWVQQGAGCRVQDLGLTSQEAEGRGARRGGLTPHPKPLQVTQLKEASPLPKVTWDSKSNELVIDGAQRIASKDLRAIWSSPRPADWGLEFGVCSVGGIHLTGQRACSGRGASSARTFAPSRPPQLTPPSPEVMFPNLSKHYGVPSAPDSRGNVPFPGTTRRKGSDAG